MLISRLVAAFGVPIAVWLFLEIWNSLKTIEAAVRANQTILAVQEYRLGQNERRINALERIAFEDQ